MKMKKNFLILVALACTFAVAHAEVRPTVKTCWSLSEEGNGIVFNPSEQELPYSDHIEMSGEQMAVVLRWGVDASSAFRSERSLVFPMLRTIPNNTHASLMHRVATDVLSLISVNGRSLCNELVLNVTIDGWVQTTSTFSLGVPGLSQGGMPVVMMDRIITPTVDKPMMVEYYTFTNVSGRPLVVYIPEFCQTLTTLPEKGVDGAYCIQSSLTGSGTYTVQPDATLSFGAVFQAYRQSEQPLVADVETEVAARRAFVDGMDGTLILDTPDEIINREFRFAKIRASESIFKTAGGYMHAPGGESYYAAIWANDQAEYVNPFFPFTGYEKGNASALNSYLHFARFMNDAYKPIPSSIIAEGKDIWNGAGDRGDAAMIAHGASRYIMARGDREEARQLWPLVTWCLEYCRRQLNEEGVVCSDSDELEGRFPAGKANLCTSTLYYDGLRSAALLARELGEGSVARTYTRQADDLEKAIENYFGADMKGFHTYRYYDGNELLRSWICMPLIVGIQDRAEGTIAALTSPALMTNDGLLTQEGSETFWDRSTLYSLRGIYIAGDTKTATDFMHHYSQTRLLGTHVPYPIEAWPEGSQRHLSAESGLYCRAIIEGMFGLRPTGLRSFTLSPRLPEGWSHIALRHVKAFGTDFDVEVTPKGKRLQVVVLNHATGKRIVRTVSATANNTVSFSLK